HHWERSFMSRTSSGGFLTVHGYVLHTWNVTATPKPIRDIPTPASMSKRSEPSQALHRSFGLWLPFDQGRAFLAGSEPLEILEDRDTNGCVRATSIRRLWAGRR